MTGTIEARFNNLLDALEKRLNIDSTVSSEPPEMRILFILDWMLDTNKVMRNALEIIAGLQQCVDNTMSDKAIAIEALSLISGNDT